MSALGLALAVGLAVLSGVTAAAWLKRRPYRRAGDVAGHSCHPARAVVAVVFGTALAAPVFPHRQPSVVATYVIAWTVLVTLAIVDLDVRRLPDSVTLPAYPVLAAALLVCAALVGDWSALWRSAVCGGVALLVFFLLALFSPGSGGLGLGDVKLAGLLGALLCWSSWLQPILGLSLGFVLGGVTAGLSLLLRRAQRTSTRPFGPFMVVGAYLIGILPAVT